MAAIVEFRVKADRLAMADALQSTPEIRIDIAQEAGTNPERPLIIFWASGGDLEAFEEALEEDPTVGDIHRYGDITDRTLYRVRLTDTVELVTYPVWVEVGAEQIEAKYYDGWWDNRYRLPNTEALEVIEEWCRDHDVPFELTGVYSQDTGEDTEAGLTAEQEEVLRAALELGYFEVPREGTLEDVADSLDISSQAASERLRRGYKQLVEQTV